MIEKLAEFLYQRKCLLLSQLQKEYAVRARDAIETQVRVIEQILGWIAANKHSEEPNMKSLELSLDKEARPNTELPKPKSQENEEMTKAVLDFVKGIPPNSHKKLGTPTIKAKTVASKIVMLKKAGKLPSTIAVTHRGADIFVVKGE
jgi:hypothetical protein